MFNIMVGIVKSFKNKILLFLGKAYKIKIDNKFYLLFEKEEHYEILSYLERVFLDLIKNNILSNDEHRKIRVFFRMSVIENYVKKLPKIKIKTFDYKNKYKYSFRKKFPNLGNLEHFIIEKNCSLCDEILVILGLMDLEVKFMDLVKIINDKISIKYY